MKLLSEKYKDKVLGTIDCFDRVIVMGTLPGLCYPQGMTCHLNKRYVRIFDYAKFAQTYRDIIVENAENLAKSIGFKIHYINNHNTKTGDIVKAHLSKLKKRGETVEGLFYIISCKELDTYYKPKYNKKTGECYLERDFAPFLHYYFYFFDKELGLCHVRVSTWLPCRIQVYFNMLHVIIG